MREADFSERIKTILCERVGGRCSNPNCRIRHLHMNCRKIIMKI